MKEHIKRLFAGCLIITLTASVLPAIPAKAEESYEETYVYDLEEQKTAILENEVAKGYETGVVTFPLSGAVVNMGNELVYHLFRQGNTEEEQTVTLVTMDLTAGYKKDYIIRVDGETVSGKSNILLDGTGTTYDVYLDEDVLSDAKEEASETSEHGTVQSTKEQLEENSSSMFDVTFAAGEQVKEIRVRAFVPDKAVGNKEFQLSIYECEDGLEQGEIITSVITLQETREVEDNEIAIVEDSTEVIDGYVTVLVERTGNTASYSSYNLSAEDGTAVNGEDYILKSTQLIFTPGVSKQRVHIPLAADEDGKTKTFTLRADSSEEEITYLTTSEGTTVFKSDRSLVDIPMEEFVKGESTVGEFTLEEDGERYVFSYSSPVGMGSNRGASIHTQNKYDFTGIEAIRLSASYMVGTIVGDHLDIYASNEDYYNNKSMLGVLESRDYGDRLSTTSLTGQGIHEIDVDREGEYYLYMTAEQHGQAGVIGYYLYNQDYDGDDEGHVALVKRAYTIEILDPSSIGTTVPAGDMTLTLSTDSSVTDSNNKITAYRDETFNISYTLMDTTAQFVGWQLVDSSGHVYDFEQTEVPAFTLTSDLIQKYSYKLVDDTFRIRPVFERESSEVEVIAQDFQAQGLTKLSASIDMSTRTAVYYDEGTEIATVTWSTSTYTKGETLQFSVSENAYYGGDYRFTAFKVEEGATSSSVLTNPIYYSDKNWSTVIDKEYYRITPIITNNKAELLLKVTGAQNGNFLGKPEDLTDDEYEVRIYEERGYDYSDIITFWAEAKEGYRVKWSYQDISSGETKTYYGNYFYYQVQVPAQEDDNWITLEFEKCEESLETFSVNAVVYMQGGDVLHEPEEDSIDYTPFSKAQVSLNGAEEWTDADGTAGVFSLDAKPGDKFTAYVLANNRSYVQEVVIGESGKSVSQEMKLSYYYEGPRVTSVQYYHYDGTRQNGDTIYLEDETDGCIIGATIETAGKEVTDIIYKLKDSNGAYNGTEYIATRNGSEYIWSATLGLLAQEGDQIWIELVNRTYDSSGNIVAETSYGEVNTGYTIVIAEYTNTSYIPDTGLDEEFNVPVFGNMYFLFGLGGLKPTFTASYSGAVTYLTVGVTYNGVINFRDSTLTSPTWGKYWKGVQDSMEAIGKKATEDERIAAKQTLKKTTLTVNVAVSCQLALYNAVDEETSQSRLLVVGGYMVLGFNGTFLFNFPLSIEGVPLFVAVTITGSFSDTVEFWSKDESGYVDLEDMHDPTKSTYKPENDMNVGVNVSIALGIGVNGILDAAGGGTGKFMLDWKDFLYGTVKMTLNIDVKFEVLLLGVSLSFQVDDYVISDNNPYVSLTAAETDEVVTQAFLNTPLRDITMKSISEYSQNTGIWGSELRSTDVDETLVSDAYEFSRPKLYDMGGHKYMVVTTVDSSLVSGFTESGMAVLAYAVYDKATGTYVTGEDGKAFISLEPIDYVGDSINFHPCVTALEDGKYMITWNSVEYGDSQKITLANIHSVIKSVIYDSATGEMTYKSLVTEDTDTNLMTGIVLDTEYDDQTGEVVMLYRVLNHTGLNENSTLSDFMDAGSQLLYTSIDVKEAFEDSNVTYKEGVVIAEGGRENSIANVIKTADLQMMKNGDENVPVITYHMAKGENAMLVGNAEEGSTNHIYLRKLTYSEAGYDMGEQKEVTADSNESYNSQPQLFVGKVDGEVQNILMWKQEERIVTVDPIAFLNGNVKSLTAEERKESEESGTTYYTGRNTATLEESTAGYMENVQVFAGEDGGIYAIWTEGTGTGTKVMMSAMEADGNNGEVRWGKGSEIFETTGQNYVKNFSPLVDENGILWLVYRETVVSNGNSNGSSNIKFRKAGLDGKLAMAENCEIELSDYYALSGESITVTGKVTNSGVRALKDQKVQLYANGEAVSGASVTIPNLGAGEEKEVSFSYIMPENAGEMVFSFFANSLVRSSTESGPALTITAINYEALDYVDENTESTYKMQVTVKNEGNGPSDDTYLVVSHLESGKDEDGSYTINDTPLSEPILVYFLEPDEEVTVEFEITVPAGYFSGNTLGLAPIGLALYENYGTDNQNMVIGMRDYIQANVEPEATTISMASSKQIGVGQRKNLTVVVTPSKAQLYTDFVFESSDKSIATVDENGIVTGVKEGTCTITVTTANGLMKTITIKVLKEAVEDDSEVWDDATGGNGSETGNTDTGDHSKWALWLAILMISGGAAAIVSCRRRKMND